MEKDLRIKKTSAADLVCARMREMVIDGTWPVNEKIPSEGKLAETFGVNRLTVRNALQRLNALGVLKTHVGDGTYVVVVMTDLSAYLDGLTPLLSALDAAHDVMCGG